MKKIFTALCGCVALLSTSCIDREFELTEVSGEMTIGGDELVVPLATISDIKLGDLLKENETIKSDKESGVYQISFSSFGEDPTKYEQIAIDGISIPAITDLSPKLEPVSFNLDELPSTMSMPGFEQTIDAEFPKVNEIMEIQSVNVGRDLAFNLPFSGKGELTDTQLAALQYNNNASLSDKYESETVFDAEINILEELNAIDWVLFGCEVHPHGTPFEIKIDLGGLHGVNGGGLLKLNVEFPDGYHLYDENGNAHPDATHNIFYQEIELQPGQDKIEAITYLNKIIYKNQNFQNGVFKIDDHIKYSYDLQFDLKAGEYDLSTLPKFSIAAAPKYKDIEVVINHFDINKVEHNAHYEFDGMPEDIKIEKVAFEDTNLRIVFDGLQWLNVHDAESHVSLTPIIKVSLPKCMKFHSHRLLDGDNNILSAEASELANGVVLQLDYIDCGSDEVKFEKKEKEKSPGVFELVNIMAVDSKIVAEVDLHAMDNHKVCVSELTPENSKFPIKVSIDDTELKLDMNKTKVVWGDTRSFDLDLGDSTPGISQSIEIPEMISKINSIAIGNANKQGEPVAIDFTLTANDAFPINNLYVDVTVNLGNLLRPTQKTLDSGAITKDNDSGMYILSINEPWNPTEGPLSKRIEFDALTNMPEIVDGKIAIDQKFDIKGCVKVENGSDINLSKISDAKINIDVKIDDIEVRKFTGGFDLAVTPDEMVVDLGDLSSLGVDINKLKLNPVLKLNLKENPTGIPFFADIAVKTLDAEGEVLTDIELREPIEISGDGATNIVISTAKNESKFEDVTFIEIEELSDLLSQGLPAKIAVNMSVKSGSGIYTIDLGRAKDGYKLEYQYEVFVPLEFDGGVDLAYSTTISGLGDTFSSLANEASGLKVGDVGLLAKFGTTIPFNIKLQAELVNADGTTSGIEAKLKIDDGSGKGNGKSGTIYGWTSEDGEEAHTSNLSIEFDLGDSHTLAALKNVDGVKLTFTLTDTGKDETSALSSEQFLNGDLKLRVRDGLTVDIFNLMNGGEE